MYDTVALVRTDKKKARSGWNGKSKALKTRDATIPPEKTSPQKIMSSLLPFAQIDATARVIRVINANWYRYKRIVVLIYPHSLIAERVM